MPTKKVYNSAITGKYVTQAYAKSHPKTTESHVVKTPPKKK